MPLPNISLSEEELLGTKASKDEIRLLWDGILDILLERIHHKSISDKELAHLTNEINALLQAVKGRNGMWGSVIEVAQQLLRKDVTIHELRVELRYNESTIYRAIGRLELVGFAISLDQNAGIRRWTINKEKCPLFYRATRQA